MQFADATIYGNLTRDAETFEYGEKKNPGAQVGVAVNRHYTQGGEKKTETGFFNVTIYGNIVKSIGQYLTKGRPVIVRGRLVQDHYQDENGVMQHRIKVVVSPYTGSIELVGNGGNGNGAGAPAAAEEAAQEATVPGDDPF